MDELVTAAERQDFMPIIKWLEGHFPNRFGVRAEDRTLSLESSRKYTAYRSGS
jgi:hypothetical protein